MKNLSMTTLYYFDFVGTYGGAQQSTVALLNKIHKDYSDVLNVHVLAVNGTNKNFIKNIEAPIHIIKIKNNLNIFKVGRKYLSTSMYFIDCFYKINKIIKKNSKKSNNVILCNSSKALYVLSLLKTFNLNYKICFYSRGSGASSSFNIITKFFLNFIVTDIYCVSSQTKENMAKFINKEKKLHVTHTSVDFKNLKDFHSQKIIDFNNVKILFAGALIPMKGLKLLLEGISQLPSSYQEKIEVFIAGGLEAPEVQNYVGECKLVCSTIKSNIHWLGWKDNMPKLISEVDIVCLPSYSEGLPRIVQEGMYMERLVIATPVGGIPSLIKDEYNGYLIDTGSSESIQKCLISVFNNKDVESMKKNAHLYVKEKFNINNQTKLIVDLIINETKKR